MKKKVLVSYPEMMVGGSTTALLAFLNCIDKEKYDVDLQLYKNRGELLPDVPEGINLLPEAFMYNGKIGTIAKFLKIILTGTVFRAYIENKKNGEKGLSKQMLSDFQALHLSRKAKDRYDVAIGFLEGWSDRYIAYRVDADKKIAWLHSTFENITTTPEPEKRWMEKVDNLVFVADNCTEDFKKIMPEMADKAKTIYNITDSSLIRKRAEQMPLDDPEYIRLRDAKCFKIITVCRVTMSVKGLDRAVSCAKKLKQNGKNFCWTIVGDGCDFEKVNALIKENGLHEEMRMIGTRLNPLPFVKEADVFCMPSRYEGKPMVITESMILGTPPFVTRYLSANEQIENGVDGVVVDNADDTIYDALERYIDDTTELEKLKQALLSREYGNPEYMREIEKEYLA